MHLPVVPVAVDEERRDRALGGEPLTQLGRAGDVRAERIGRHRAEATS